MDTPWNRRILVVDDNEAIHRDFRKILLPRAVDAELARLEGELFGASEAPANAPQFTVDSALQGEVALAMVERARAEERPYSLAFMDVRMPPGWDGVETTARIWAVEPDLQVVICTAYSDFGWQEIAQRLGGGDSLLILRKPFDHLEVLQLAHALTRKWTLHAAELASKARLEHLVQERTAELTAAKRDLERKLVELAQVESELQLARRLEAIGQLAAGVAHEINTPIQYVGDSVTFLRDATVDLFGLLANYRMAAESVPALWQGELGEDLRRTEEEVDLAYLRENVPLSITRALDGVDRVARIVRAMKVFAHTNLSERSRADLNEALRNTLEVARSEYKYVADVKTTFGVIPEVECHVGDLNQVFLNVIVNAAHAIADVVGNTGERGTITVRSRLQGDQVIISIADTGTGIPEAIRGRIFDPFFTTKDVGKGTGQGLALAHAIMKKHGGTIAVESEVGKGSTFHLQLPA